MCTCIYTQTYICIIGVHKYASIHRYFLLVLLVCLDLDRFWCQKWYQRNNHKDEFSELVLIFWKCVSNLVRFEGTSDPVSSGEKDTGSSWHDDVAKGLLKRSPLDTCN